MVLLIEKGGKKRIPKAATVAVLLMSDRKVLYNVSSKPLCQIKDETF